MRAKLLIVVALLAVGGGLYYLFGVFFPGREKGAARAEIERWEVRLDKVRSCLLGPAPASPSIGEALAIYELTDEPDRKACTQAISELSRGDAPDTGIAAVEAAWREIGSAASKVASGFALYLDPRGDTSDRLKAQDRLGPALANLIAAHRALREAAGMAPPPEPKIAALPRADVIPLGTGENGKLTAWLRPSAGGQLVQVSSARKTGGPGRQVILIPGQPPRIAARESDVHPSATDPTWGAGAGDGAIETGAIDPAGKVSGTATPTGSKTGVPHLLFALGNAASGVVALIPDAAQTPLQVTLARTTNAGVELEPAREVDDYAFGIDPAGLGGSPANASGTGPAGRGLLAWSNKGKLSGTIVRPGSPTKIVELGSGTSGLACLTATHGWVASGDQFVAFDDVGATPRVLPGNELIGCDATSVLLRKAGHRYSVCTAAGCRLVELQARAPGLPALAGGQVIAVTARRGVLAVWREKAPPLYVSLPSPIDPKLVHATAKVIDVLGETDSGLAIARIAL